MINKSHKLETHSLLERKFARIEWRSSFDGNLNLTSPLSFPFVRCSRFPEWSPKAHTTTAASRCQVAENDCFILQVHHLREDKGQGSRSVDNIKSEAAAHWIINKQPWFPQTNSVSDSAQRHCFCKHQSRTQTRRLVCAYDSNRDQETEIPVSPTDWCQEIIWNSHDTMIS